MGNPVVFFEIGADDYAAVERFYSELFGWGMQQLPGGGYTLIDTRSGMGITGGIGRSLDGTPWATFYVQVDDIQQVLDEVEAGGGKTVVPMTVIPNMLTWGMFTDPDGALVGLFTPAPFLDQKPSAGDAPGVDWFEVLGPDVDRTWSFYADLFGWTTDDSGGYRGVDTQSGRGIGGGVGGGGGATWATFYVKVPDVERALARVEQLGGKREYGPNDVGPRTRAGAFRDFAGNVVGVYQYAGG